MKRFETPKIEISRFDAETVTTNSNGGGSKLAPGTAGAAGSANISMGNTYNAKYDILW